MNIIEQAESDLSFTLEDNENGFGVALVLIDDLCNRYPVIVQTTDIGFFIDPQTGEGAASRQIEVTVRISTLNSLGGDYITKSWTAEYTDTNGKTWKLRVQQPRPDRKLGIYNLVMEIIKV